MNGRVGYRFHPTDEELVDYFLRHKLNGVDFDDDIRFIDILKYEPWELPKYAAQGSDDQVWYFFYRREKRYRTASKPRYNRSTETGHWKPTGAERPVRAKRSRQGIGLKRTLVFYKYCETKELRTNWVIHEYEPKACPPNQAELVLGRLKEKVDGKADASACRVAESSHSGGASGFEIHTPEVPISQIGQLQLETLFPDRVVNYDQPPAFQPQIQIENGFFAMQPQIHLEEGLSIDDLMLPDDVFQNDLTNQFDITGLQQNTNEVDDSFFIVADEFTGADHVHEFSADPHRYDLEETASNAYTHRNHSSSPQSMSGVYLEEVCDMDSDDVYVRSSQFGEKIEPASSRGYRQMTRVQAITETLSPSRYEQSGTKKNCVNRDEILVMEASSADSVVARHEKINVTGNQPRSGKNTVEKKRTQGGNQVQVKPGTSEPKAREARKRDTDRDLPHESPVESIEVKSERARKMVNQRSHPLSVYIVNVFVGTFLFIVASRELLILH